MSDEQSSGDEQMLRDELFKLTMRQEWEVVVKKYVENTNAHTLKLTKSEDTAFHIAISSYNPKCPNPNLTHQRCTEEMFSLMKERKSLCNVVKMANVRGDTPLHLAAAVGWEALCTRIASADPKLNANGETPLSDDPKLIQIRNANGETPLSDDPMLIQIRNANGETPLFIAAHHGNLNTFLALHDFYKPDETLCRRKDGNTILHSAISGEYLRLAYSILDKYKNLLNSVNVEGETPLHVLARKPNLFKSSSQLGFYESVIYEFVFVDDLKKQSKHNPSASQSNGSSKEKFPESYKTCVSIFHLLWDPIYNSYKGKRSTQQPYEEHGVPIYESFLAGCSRSKKQIAPPTVENVEHQRKRSTQQPYEEHDVPIYESFSAGCSRSKKQIAPPTVENVEHQTKVEKKKSKDYGSFPPNYTTCIKIFKFATTVALTILGIGFLRIRKIHNKKVRHSHAMEIMNRMIESERSYKYNNDGQRPIHQYSEASTIPDIPPNDAETQTQESKDDHNIGDDKSKSCPLLVATEMGIPKIVKKLLDAVPTAIKDQNSEIVKKILDVVKDKYSKSLVKDTPLLVAAKMGIPEIVKKILEVVPIAIQDQDSEGKNVLMVAAENRQTSVFNFLIDEAKLPEYVFHHFDNQGNGILHLAAKLGEKQPWRIPGAALQMQWEIKWYKHVKRSVPALCYSQHNAKDETPRRIFTQTHENLVKSGNEWLVKTAESCSVVAALIATVAFATSATVPGGLDQVKGYPILIDRNAFDIFSIASLIALCLSITALVFLLAIITSRFEERDFKRDLPRKLLMGMSCLFSGIAAMLLSFCAGHTFILREKLRIVAVPIYTAAMIPVLLFAMGQLPLYFDLVWAAYVKVPLRSYKLYHQ